VTGFTTFDQAQNALLGKAAHGLSRWPAGAADGAGEPRDGKAEPPFSFEAAMPQEMIINSAVDHGQAQPRGETVFELFQDAFGVGLFVFHGIVQNGRKGQQGCPSAELKIDGTPQRGDAARRTEIWGAWAKEKARTEAIAAAAKGN
jgi:hypothetical protein